MTARRKVLLGGAVVIVAAVAVAAATIGPALVGDRDRDDKAKNIILMIGDGMGQTHVNAARQIRHGAAGSLVMETLGGYGTVSTWAVLPDSAQPALVTDSASAATAWASGVKTYNDAIGVDAYGTVVPTLMEQAKTAGMRTGNVTTSEITDATPAAQFSHAAERDCQGPDYTEDQCDTIDGGEYPPIAQQIARNNVADVILGGGNDRFTDEDQQIMRDNGYLTLGEFGNKVATKAELEAVDGTDRKVIGLFNESHLTVEVNKAKSFPTAAVNDEPSLKDMTVKALDLLTDSAAEDTGFFLQVEGASIDKRSHDNDAAQAIGETLAFDDAVAEAKQFAEQDGDTLVIVTADHECGGFSIVEKDKFTNAEAAAPPGNQSGTSSTQTPVREESGDLDSAHSVGPVNGSGSGDPTNFAPATLRTADDPSSVQDGDEDASLWVTYLSG